MQTQNQRSCLPACLSQVCLELHQTWMESGVSEDAVSGHIQVCVCVGTSRVVLGPGFDGEGALRDGVL